MATITSSVFALTPLLLSGFISKSALRAEIIIASISPVNAQLPMIQSPNIFNCLWTFEPFEISMSHFGL